MKARMLMAAGMMALLGGCATYDYTDGYYRGSPDVRYRYPPGYYGGYDGYYGYPYYYSPGWLGLYDYPVYPGRYYNRPIRRPPPRPGNDYPGPRPPGNAGPRPPRPSQPSVPRPPRPSEPRPSSSPSPWRDLNRIKQGARPARKTQEP